MTKAILIAHHGHCFDGMASAALLTRLFQQLEPGPLSFRYTGLNHQPRGSYVPAEEVVERDGRFVYPGPGGEVEVFQEFGKIGKSLKNSISPDEICDDYGADTLRVYEMSMGPLEASRPWATKDVVGD